ncbi:MAG: DUF885 domain-containing protein [Tetrasphaera sp.]|nr:DUF885 domain-containing protein [Tetrasphaera sp.]
MPSPLGTRVAWPSVTETSSSPRTPTAVDAIADQHFDRSIELSPISATYLGVAGHDRDLDDFSPAGAQAHATLAAETLARLAAATPADATDEVTIAAMRERLELQLEVHASGWDAAAINVLACPLQEIRSIFDLMDTSTDTGQEAFTARMGQVPGALDGWRESLSEQAAQGRVAARRQVLAAAAQCDELVATDGYFAGLVANTSVEGTRRGDLERAVAAAATAYESLGGFLREVILPEAPERDGVGRERYALTSRQFLGATIDLEETYAWGQEELARITEQMAETAERIRPGASVKEAIEALDTDPAYALHGTDALRAWMQERADEAIAMLAGTHFDIPEPVRTIECCIAPTQTGGIYYTGPSEDFTRPGRMWWSVPKGVTDFGTWRELTTVYHEGVPGHHLQVAQTTYRRAELNRWRRLMCWVSGHGEGWALYAEWLMAELGAMDDPGNYLGLLDGQSLRAARVVLDIGVHCDFPAPSSLGGGAWTYEKAWDFLNRHANAGEGQLRFELDRYLGWPGQAPSYKIGERLWMQIRAELAERDGAAFDLKGFHRRALDLGSVGLDVMRGALLGSA